MTFLPSASRTEYREPDERGSERDSGYGTPEDAADSLAETLMERLGAPGGQPDDAAFRTAVCLIALELHSENRTARADRRREAFRQRIHESYLTSHFDL